MTDNQPVGCGVCEEGLHRNGIAGVDPDLGPICFECEPHLLMALRMMRVAMQRG
jgi:hypothetical protein